jgi:hypothetical protein
MKTVTFIMGASLSMLLVSIPSAQGFTSTNYGNYEGSMVWYNQVSETTDVGAYRAPIVSLDSLNFSPLGLKAESAGGGSDDVNNAALSLGIQAKSGKFIAGFLFEEAGDFIMGGPLGTDATFVDVTANFLVSIDEVDGSAIGAVTDNLSMTFSPNADGTFELVTDGGGGFGSYLGGWDGSIYIDLFGILADNSVDYVSGVTHANLSLVNVLTAGSEESTSSLIQKDLTTTLSITSDVIPEPASLLLMVGTTLGLAFSRRRFVG